MIHPKTQEKIKNFMSFCDAARYIQEIEKSSDTINGIASHISDVCNGKRKTAYGFIWKFE